MVYIPNDKSLKHTFKYVDTMFGNWFSNHGYTFSQQPTGPKDFSMPFAGYFGNVASFTPDQVLTGMLLMYYNYPINWLGFNDANTQGSSLWYQMSLYKIICFLKKSKMPNIKENVYKIAETILPLDQTLDTFVAPLFDITGKASIDIFVKAYPDHILSNKRIVHLIKEREKSKLFDTDKELVAMLNKVLLDKVKADIAIFAKDQQKLADEKDRNRKIQTKKANQRDKLISKMLEKATDQVQQEKDQTKKFLKYTGDFLY